MLPPPPPPPKIRRSSFDDGRFVFYGHVLTKLRLLRSRIALGMRRLVVGAERCLADPPGHLLNDFVLFEISFTHGVGHSVFGHRKFGVRVGAVIGSTVDCSEEAAIATPLGFDIGSLSVRRHPNHTVESNALDDG